MLLHEKLHVDLQVPTPESLFRTIFLLLLQPSCNDVATKPCQIPGGCAEWLGLCTHRSSLCFFYIDVPDWALVIKDV